MRQRIVGAIGISCEPRLLIADEPTTSLDLTIQAQYLNLLRELQREHGLALIFITHNLGIVAKMCDQLAVMYAGRVVEQGPVSRIFNAPAHPYTKALLGSIPRMSDNRQRLTAIEGQPPDLVLAAARLLLRAALPRGVRPLPRRGAARIRRRRRPHGALLARAGRRNARRPGRRRGAACMTAVLEADDAHQAFPGRARHVRRRSRRGARGRRHLLHHRRRQDARAWSASRAAARRRRRSSCSGWRTPTGGTIRFEGRDLGGLDAAGRRHYRKSVQAVFQDPYASLNPRMRISAIIAEPLITNETVDAAERAQARAGAARPGRPAGALGRSVPARILGRPAPAHRDRPRAGRCRPGWSCSTSRSRRSTCRSARRSSICCATCRRGSASPTCSSPTTSPPWRI